MRCPKCEYTAGPDKFRNGCPICGYSDPRQKHIIAGDFKKKPSVEYSSTPLWVWISALALLSLALFAFINTLFG